MGILRVPRILGMAAVAALALAIPQPVSAVQGQVLGADRAGGIPDSYIVQIKDSAAPKSASAQTARTLTATYGGHVKMAWQHALNGFAVTMNAEQAAKMAADPRVEFVQQDAVVRINDTQPGPPSWGLDRIDQRDLPLGNSYIYDSTAANVHAYVIDSGIRTTHSTFGGRATWGTNTTGDGNNTDCNGHGTHVAGTVGGSQYGVAKGVQLVAVKVLDCGGSGSFSGVAAGIDWVAANAIKPAVANMSLGAQGSDLASENAVRNAIASGVTFTISSGNSNADACNFTPAKVGEAITVNSADSNDTRSSLSNFGPCTDIFAPGVSITSSWNTSDTAVNTISGTSMAAPHTTGAAALWLATHPNDTPAAVQAALITNSTPDKITNPGAGSPNRLLFTNPRIVPVGDPGVTNPGPQTGNVATATRLQLAATGGTPPYTWTSATGLPEGLSLDGSTGLISGTPKATGTSTVTVTATDSAGKTGSATFTWTIAEPGVCPAPGQKIVNPGFESGAASWTATAGVIGQHAGQPAHDGTWNAWVDGYGSAHTDSVSQSVTIPAGCTTYSLSYWLHIDSAETTTSVQRDTLTVQVGSSTLATYSNLDKAAGYRQRTFDLSQFAGQTVTLKFTGTESVALQTSFVLDDITLTVS